MKKKLPIENSRDVWCQEGEECVTVVGEDMENSLRYAAVL